MSDDLSPDEEAAMEVAWREYLLQFPKASKPLPASNDWRSAWLAACRYYCALPNHDTRACIICDARIQSASGVCFACAEKQRAEIERLEAAWRSERDLANRTATKLFKEKGKNRVRDAEPTPFDVAIAEQERAAREGRDWPERDAQAKAQYEHLVGVANRPQPKPGMLLKFAGNDELFNIDIGKKAWSNSDDVYLEAIYSPQLLWSKDKAKG